MDDSKNQSKLVQIEDLADLKKLRDLFLVNWPEHCVHYFCLDNFVKWLEKLGKCENLSIFSLDNNWKETGIYLIVDRYQLFAGTLSQSWNPLLEKALHQLEWKNGFKVSSLHQRHREPVINVIKHKNLKIEYDSYTCMYYLPKEEAINIKVNCPEDYEIRPMSEDDVTTVNNLWPNKHQGSEFFIKRQIDLSINVGLYSKASGDLVAWCIRLQGGFAGALQVKNEFKRKGLGSVVLAAFSKEIAKSGQDVIALVNADNVPSKKLFEKFNFKVIDACYWIRTFPTAEGSEWPDGI